jgi:hypothetical protein
VGAIQRLMPPSRRRQPLKRRSATSARDRVEIEVPAPKLDLTNVDAFHQMYSVRVPTSIKTVDWTVRAWSVGDWPELPPAQQT